MTRSEADYIGLLKSWWHECQHGHKECQRRAAAAPLPTRVLRIDPTGRSVYLVDGASIKGDSSFAALSHPWGPESRSNRHFRLTKEKMAEFRKGIPVSSMPKNFQEAVQVAHCLGLQYLWIDSICIIQKSANDPGDFAQEASKMGEYYHSAAIVIAATGATTQHSGFMRGFSPKEYHEDDRVPLFSDAHRTVFARREPSDFEAHVEQGHLNSRAWVLQERALASRMLHFTSGQTYWQCRQGVRSETLCKMTK